MNRSRRPLLAAPDTGTGTRPQFADDIAAKADPDTARHGGEPSSDGRRPLRSWAGPVLIAVILVAAPLLTGDVYYQGIAKQAFVYIALAVSYQLLSGYIRLVSFGHVAFFGISAFTCGVLVSTDGFDFPVAAVISLAVAGVVALVVALLLLKLESLLLTLATLAVAQIVVSVVSSLQVTGGENGLLAPAFTVPGVPAASLSYWFVAACMLVVLLVSVLITRGPLGRLFLAVGDDPTAARAVGVNATRVMVYAFVLCSTMAGIAGIMLTQTAVVMAPGNINLSIAILVLAMVGVGGTRSIGGAIVGAVLLTLLPIVFAPIAQYQTLVYGVILIAVVLLAPQGLGGLDRAVTRWVRRTS